MVISYSLAYFGLTMDSCVKVDLDAGSEALQTMETAMFLTLGTCFFVSGVLMIVGLKKHFPHFYAGIKC